MTKKTSRMIAAFLIAAAVGFILFAFSHPELSFPWSSRTTYFFYGGYFLLIVLLLIAPFQTK